MPVAELSGLTVLVDTGRWRETVLDAVNLAVPAGEITALLGESGCGKSMVAAAMTGHLPATAHRSGEVRVEGVAVSDQRDWRRLRESTIGYLPQAGVTAFAADETVGAQLRESRRTWRVEDACTAALYPKDVADLLPGQHSTGQIQRAALAAALLPAPRLLVADEPTASLDTGTARQVWLNLRAFADTGAAVLAVTHDAPLLAETGVADRMVFLRSGRVVAGGTAADMRADPDPYVRGFFPGTR